MPRPLAKLTISAAALLLTLSAAPAQTPRGLLITGDLDPASFAFMELPNGKPRPLFTPEEIRRLSSLGRGTNFVQVSAPRGGRVAVSHGRHLFLKSVRTASMRPVPNPSRREILTSALDPTGLRIGAFLIDQWHLAGESTVLSGDLVVFDSLGGSRLVAKGLVMPLVGAGIAWNREGTALVAGGWWPSARAREALGRQRAGTLPTPSTHVFPLSGTQGRALHPGVLGVGFVDSPGWLVFRADGKWIDWSTGREGAAWTPPEEGAQLVAAWSRGGALWSVGAGVVHQATRGAPGRLVSPLRPSLHVTFGN